jgi:RNA polymerase sigma factor (TIGR02999 family)
MDITRLLQAANDGQKEAMEQLAPLVYDELRWLAHRQMQQEFGPRTLSTTGLVHEAYLKLVDGQDLPAENRRHFFAAAARAMRQIMVSEARRRGADKRGSNAVHLTLDSAAISIDELSTEILALDQALGRLESVDSRLAQVVECRFFGGLTVDETSIAVSASTRTVKRDWRLARAWLFRELNGSASGPA